MHLTILYIGLRFLLTSLLVLLVVEGFSQSTKDIDRLHREEFVPVQSEYLDSVKVFTSEYDLVFSSLFRFYKKHISSQDASTCSFSPTCSEYAVMAIRKQGIFEGIINFWDRFSRCNGMSPEHYPIDTEKKLLIDPVRDWHYHEK